MLDQTIDTASALPSSSLRHMAANDVDALTAVGLIPDDAMAHVLTAATTKRDA